MQPEKPSQISKSKESRWYKHSRPSLTKHDILLQPVTTHKVNISSPFMRLEKKKQLRPTVSVESIKVRHPGSQFKQQTYPSTQGLMMEEDEERVINIKSRTTTQGNSETNLVEEVQMVRQQQ